MPEGAPPAASHTVKVGDISIGNDRPLVLLAGPCAMESRPHALEMAAAIRECAAAAGLKVIYKSSFDKANRTSVDSPRGLGLKDALPVFAEVKETVGIPVLIDVHTEEQ